MIHVVAVLTAKPGKRQALLDAIRENLPAVQGEEGCVAYAPFADAPFTRAKFGEDSIVILEEWTTPEALAAHGKAAHMASFRAATAEFVTGPATVHILTPAA